MCVTFKSNQRVPRTHARATVLHTHNAAPTPSCATGNSAIVGAFTLEELKALAVNASSPLLGIAQQALQTLHMGYNSTALLDQIKDLQALASNATSPFADAAKQALHTLQGATGACHAVLFCAALHAGSRR